VSLVGTDFRNRYNDGILRARTEQAWTFKTWPSLQDLLLAQGFVLANGDGHEYGGKECAA
jgi:hypothetical protein